MCSQWSMTYILLIAPSGEAPVSVTLDEFIALQLRPPSYG